MKNTFLFPALLFFICSHTLSAQWKKVDMGLNVTGAGPAIKLSDRIVVQGDKKLYTKLEGDTIWKPLQSIEYSEKNLGNKVRTKGDTILSFTQYKEGSEYSLYYSVDKGASWFTKVNGLPDKSFPEDILIDHDTIFMLSRYQSKLYSSTDLGQTWKVYTALPENARLEYITKIGHRIFGAKSLSSQYDTTLLGISLTEDYGASWQIRNNGLTNMYIKLLRSKDSILYVGTALGLFVSKNYGEDWQPASIDLPTGVVEYMDFEGDTLAVVFKNGEVYMSADNGKNWQSIGDDIMGELADPNTFKTGLAVRKGAIYISSARGLFATTDGGLHWKIESFQGANPGPFVLEVSNSKLYAGTFNFGLFRSEDNGGSWRRIDSNFSGEVAAAPAVWSLTFTGSKIFAVTYFSNNFYIADHDSLQWRNPYPKLGSGRIGDIIEYKGILVMNHSNGLFYSVDGGLNWIQKVQGWDFSGQVLKCRVFSDTLFAPANGGIMFTTDGLNWSTYRPKDFGTFVDFRKYGSYEMITHSYEIPYKGIVSFSILSRDRGRTWDTLPYTAEDIYFNGREILASFRDKGISYSNDSGKTWTEKSDGMESLDKQRSYSFLVVGDTIFAYGGAGIYKDALRNYVTSVEEVQEFVPNYFYHYLPYPLPTNDQIKVNVYWGSDVELNAESIEVFTVLGEKVSGGQDISISKQTASNGTITWNCRSMPPGAYVMKVQHGATTSAIKIMLAK